MRKIILWIEISSHKVKSTIFGKKIHKILGEKIHTISSENFFQTETQQFMMRFTSGNRRNTSVFRKKLKIRLFGLWIIFDMVGIVRLFCMKYEQDPSVESCLKQWMCRAHDKSTKMPTNNSNLLFIFVVNGSWCANEMNAENCETLADFY